MVGHPAYSNKNRAEQLPSSCPYPPVLEGYNCRQSTEPARNPLRQGHCNGKQGRWRPLLQRHGSTSHRIVTTFLNSGSGTKPVVVTSVINFTKCPYTFDSETGHKTLYRTSDRKMLMSVTGYLFIYGSRPRSTPADNWSGSDGCFRSDICNHPFMSYIP